MDEAGEEGASNDGGMDGRSRRRRRRGRDERPQAERRPAERDVDKYVRERGEKEREKGGAQALNPFYTVRDDEAAKAPKEAEATALGRRWTAAGGGPARTAFNE